MATTLTTGAILGLHAEREKAYALQTIKDYQTRHLLARPYKVPYKRPLKNWNIRKGNV